MRKRQSHCVRGHPRTPENLRSNGTSLYCKLCAPFNDKSGRARRRQADPFGFALQQLRRNAKKRGFEFSITKADLLPLPTVCPVFGTPLIYSGEGGPNAASIDRSDSAKGFVRGNVVVMSNRANHLPPEQNGVHIRDQHTCPHTLDRPLHALPRMVLHRPIGEELRPFRFDLRIHACAL